jgi:hypothetical protein
MDIQSSLTWVTVVPKSDGIDVLLAWPPFRLSFSQPALFDGSSRYPAAG